MSLAFRSRLDMALRADIDAPTPVASLRFSTPPTRRTCFACLDALSHMLGTLASTSPLYCELL